MTGRDLATATGLHPTTISNILHYRFFVKPATGERLAKAIGCPVEMLGLELMSSRPGDGGNCDHHTEQNYLDTKEIRK